MRVYSHERLTTANGDLFAGMTYGGYKPSVRLPELMLHKTIALGLFADGKPAGLALAQARLRDLRHDSTCLLLSIFVEAEHRRQRQATNLIRRLAEVAREEGFRRLIAQYNALSPKAPMIGALLNAAGFTPPEPAVHRCTMNARDVVRAPILRHTRLPPGYETRFWRELNAAARARIVREIEVNPSYDVRMYPESHSAPIESRCSLVLEYNGRIVGWFVARLTAPGHLEYSSLFIAPEHRHHRTVAAVIARAVNAQVRTDLREPYPTGSFVVLSDHPRWRDSLLRSFQPYSDAVAPEGKLQVLEL